MFWSHCWSTSHHAFLLNKSYYYYHYYFFNLTDPKCMRNIDVCSNVDVCSVLIWSFSDKDYVSSLLLWSIVDHLWQLFMNMRPTQPDEAINSFSRVTRDKNTVFPVSIGGPLKSFAVGFQIKLLWPGFVFNSTGFNSNIDNHRFRSHMVHWANPIILTPFI